MHYKTQFMQNHASRAFSNKLHARASIYYHKRKHEGKKIHYRKTYILACLMKSGTVAQYSYLVRINSWHHWHLPSLGSVKGPSWLEHLVTTWRHISGWTRSGRYGIHLHKVALGHRRNHLIHTTLHPLKRKQCPSWTVQRNYIV